MLNKLEIFIVPLKILPFLSSELKTKSILLIVLMFFSAFTEALGIGVVIPFISILINPKIFYENEIFISFFDFFNIESSSIETIDIIIVFLFTIILATVLKVAILKYSISLSKIAGAEIGIRIFKNILYKPFDEQMYFKSNEIMSTMTYRLESMTVFIFHFFTVLAGIVIFSVLLIFLSLLNFSLVIYAVLPLVIAYILLGIVAKKYLNKFSIILQNSSDYRIKTIQDSLGSIRDIILNFAQNNFINIFSKYEYNFRNTESKIAFISAVPRHILETTAIILLTFFCILLLRLGKQSTDLLVIIGTLAYGAQRTLPIIQQIYNSWSNFYGHKKSITNVVNLVTIEKDIIFFPDNFKKLDFKKSIILKDISFKYPNSDNYVFKNINIEIKKGQKVAILGKTGSGKSTLIDLIIGLIKPNKGEVLVDQKNIKDNIKPWLKNISHVPQEIFLLSDTIYKNIEFLGNTKFINSEINSAAKIAEIDEFTEKLEDKLDSYVGDNGKNLSGGQKQRIGLARAFLRRRDILILDEATNQLDSFTESKIFQNIQSQMNNLTLIVITHRQDKLKMFDQIIKLDELKK